MRQKLWRNSLFLHSLLCTLRRPGTFPGILLRTVISTANIDGSGTLYDTVVGVYINTTTTYSEIIIFIYRFPYTPIPSFIQFLSWDKERYIIREGAVNGEDYIQGDSMIQVNLKLEYLSGFKR